ncbi:MAG: guanylate kinase [Rhodothermales bacterium]|nr:guanylate kinase [Rhodothermales bacterium]
MSRSKTSSKIAGSDRKIVASGRKIVVLTAPSGSGKTSIAHQLLERIPELRFSVSATTRPRRPHEQDGVDYHFVSLEEFERLRERGELLEYEEVYPGRFYGTLLSEVERSAKDGPVLLDIEVKGATNVKRAFRDESLVVFIRPPSMEELERRLLERGSEDDESFRERVRRARHELEYADRFDAVVVNDVLDRAVDETLALVQSFLQEQAEAAGMPTRPDASLDGGVANGGTPSREDALSPKENADDNQE